MLHEKVCLGRYTALSAVPQLGSDILLHFSIEAGDRVIYDTRRTGDKRPRTIRLSGILSRTDLGSILLQLREGIASEHHVVLRDDLKLPMKKPSIVAERRKAKTTERLKKRKARAELESRGEKASWDEWLALLSSDDEVAEDDAHNDVLVETDDSIKPKATSSILALIPGHFKLRETSTTTSTSTATMSSMTTSISPSDPLASSSAEDAYQSSTAVPPVTSLPSASTSSSLSSTSAPLPGVGSPVVLRCWPCLITTRKNVDERGQLKKEIIKEGTSPLRPNDGATVVARIKVYATTVADGTIYGNSIHSSSSSSSSNNNNSTNNINDNACGREGGEGQHEESGREVREGGENQEKKAGRGMSESDKMEGGYDGSCVEDPETVVVGDNYEGTKGENAQDESTKTGGDKSENNKDDTTKGEWIEWKTMMNRHLLIDEWGRIIAASGRLIDSSGGNSAEMKNDNNITGLSNNNIKNNDNIENNNSTSDPETFTSSITPSSSSSTSPLTLSSSSASSSLPSATLDAIAKQHGLIVRIVGEDWGGMPPAVEALLCTMTEGEVARGWAKPGPYGLTQSQADALGVSKSISLYIELELIAFKKGPERWEMTQEQRLQVMERMKRRANSLVAAGLDTVPQAEKLYEKALGLIHRDAIVEDSIKPRLQQLRVTLFSNMALCRAKLGDQQSSLIATEEALRIDPTHVKSLVRRGHARLKCGDLELAKQDVDVALKHSPKDEAVLQLHRLINQALTKSQALQKRAFTGIFAAKPSPS